MDEITRENSQLSSAIELKNTEASISDLPVIKPNSKYKKKYRSRIKEALKDDIKKLGLNPIKANTYFSPEYIDEILNKLPKNLVETIRTECLKGKEKPLGIASKIYKSFAENLNGLSRIFIVRLTQYLYHEAKIQRKLEKYVEINVDREQERQELITLLKDFVNTPDDQPELKEKILNNLNKLLNLEEIRSVNTSKFLDESNISGLYTVKGELLDALIKKCLVRVKKIELSQFRKSIPDTKLEEIIIKYIKEIRETLTVIDRLNSEATTQQKEQVITIVQSEIGPIIKIIREVVDEVCPEKKNVFLSYLKSKISDYMSSVMSQVSKSDTKTEVAQLISGAHAN